MTEILGKIYIFCIGHFLDFLHKTSLKFSYNFFAFYFVTRWNSCSSSSSLFSCDAFRFTPVFTNRHFAFFVSLKHFMFSSICVNSSPKIEKKNILSTIRKVKTGPIVDRISDRPMQHWTCFYLYFKNLPDKTVHSINRWPCKSGSTVCLKNVKLNDNTGTKVLCRQINMSFNHLTYIIQLRTNLIKNFN